MPKKLIPFDPARATVKTRQQAFLDGDIRYWTGEPCNRGHISQRYTANTCCVECQKPSRPARHPMSSDLVSYAPRLWCSSRQLRNGNWRAGLDKYLQLAADVARVRSDLSGLWAPVAAKPDAIIDPVDVQRIEATHAEFLQLLSQFMPMLDDPMKL